MGDIIALSSAKKQVGKSSVCIELAFNLSRNNKKVLLVDLSNGSKKISDYLDVNHEIIYDVTDLLDGVCSFKQAILQTEGIDLIPFPRIQEKFSGIKRDKFISLINQIQDSYDYIILDIDNIVSTNIEQRKVNHLIVLNNNEYSSINEIIKEKNIAKTYDINLISIIINRFESKKEAKTMLRKKDFKKLFKKQDIQIIQEDNKYFNMDKKSLISFDDNTFNRTIKNICAKFN